MTLRVTTSDVGQNQGELEKMTHEDLCAYFEQLAEDHTEAGKYATAADYLEAAARIRNLDRAYRIVRADSSSP